MTCIRKIVVLVLLFTVGASGFSQSADQAGNRTLHRFRSDGKWGFIDSTGKTVVAPAFDHAYPYRNGFAVVYNGPYSGGKRAYLNESGKQITGFDFDEANYFFGTLAVVKSGKKYAYVSKTGKLATGFEFDTATDFDNEIGIVRVGDYRTGKDGLVRPDGSTWFGDFYTAIPTYPQFSVNGFGVYAKGNLYGILHRDGRKITDPIFSSIGPFTNGLSVVRFNGKYGIIDETGEFVVAAEYDSISDWLLDGFDGGGIPVTYQRAAGFIDRRGNRLFEFRYDIASKFIGGIAIVGTGKTWKDRKFGLVGMNGAEIVPPVYEDMRDYGTESFVIVRQDGKYGILDRSGRPVCETIYDSINPFSQGLAAVRLNGAWGYIDTRGETVVKPVWDMAYDFSDGLAVVRTGTYKGGKRGYIDLEGRVKIQPQFDWAYSFVEGVAHVAFGDFNNGTFGYIDRNGTYLKKP